MILRSNMTFPSNWTVRANNTKGFLKDLINTGNIRTLYVISEHKLKEREVAVKFQE